MKSVLLYYSSKRRLCDSKEMELHKALEEIIRKKNHEILEYLRIAPGRSLSHQRSNNDDQSSLYFDIIPLYNSRDNVLIENKHNCTLVEESGVVKDISAIPPVAVIRYGSMMQGKRRKKNYKKKNNTWQARLVYSIINHLSGVNEII